MPERLLAVSSTKAEIFVSKTALLSYKLPSSKTNSQKIRERLLGVILCPFAISDSSSNLSSDLIPLSLLLALAAMVRYGKMFRIKGV